MEAPKQNTDPSKSSLLAALRDIGRNRTHTPEDLRHVAGAQANALREALLGPVSQLPDRLPDMFPSITVKYVAALPVAGLAFWSEQRWHIHIRRDDLADERLCTLLHQLKRIVDHPLHRRMPRITEADWDASVNYFVHQVLTSVNNLISVQEERRFPHEQSS